MKMPEFLPLQVYPFTLNGEIIDAAVKKQSFLGFTVLALKVPVITAADNSLEYVFIVFQRKYNLIFPVKPLLGKGFT